MFFPPFNNLSLCLVLVSSWEPRSLPPTVILHVEIGDDGPGIPPENRPSIFRSFFQANNAHQGTGLGLAVCSQVRMPFFLCPSSKAALSFHLHSSLIPASQIVSLMKGHIAFHCPSAGGSIFLFAVALELHPGECLSVHCCCFRLVFSCSCPLCFLEASCTTFADPSPLLAASSIRVNSSGDSRALMAPGSGGGDGCAPPAEEQEQGGQEQERLGDRAAVQTRVLVCPSFFSPQGKER